MKSVASFFNLKGAKLTSTRTITGVALFVALFVALRLFNIQLSATLKVSFAVQEFMAFGQRWCTL